MQNYYFNVKLDFDKKNLDNTIFEAIKNGKAGYVCSVESNNLTVANNNPEFLKVLNSALVNNCDGSVLAKILGHMHKEQLDSYIGADIFIKYVKLCRFRQFFLGNTIEVLNGLKSELSKIDPKIGNMRFETLPFKKVEDFDYEDIAKIINEDNPDIIWVSLGAPKQEIFMNKLQPYLNRGVMFGFGAIFNFYAQTGNVKRAPKWMLARRLEWLHRALEQPKKNIPRYWNFIKTLPRLIKEEKGKIKISTIKMNKEQRLIQIAQRIHALSQSGLAYVKDEYQIERYEEMMKLSDEIISLSSDIDFREISKSFILSKEYATPKLDVRAVVFNERRKILLVQEKCDGLWSLPGGWSDVGFSPIESVLKELKEETGYDGQAIRMLALIDRKKWNQPPTNFYSYKYFVECSLLNNENEKNNPFDILGYDFFAQEGLPELSTERVTKEQIDLMFDYYNNPAKMVYID